MKSRSRHARAGSGFTLLEVLGAVAVLGLWYTVLAGIAIQGLRGEGESERRLRASLIADEVLADLEVQVASGTVPPLSSEETQRDEFTVRVDVTNLELPFTPGDLESETGRPATRDPTAPQSILTTRARDGASPLRTLHVEVEWIEGTAERSVARTTYAFDLDAARPLLEGIAAAEDDEAGLESSLEEERGGRNFEEDDGEDE